MSPQAWHGEDRGRVTNIRSTQRLADAHFRPDERDATYLDEQQQFNTSAVIIDRTERSMYSSHENASASGDSNRNGSGFQNEPSQPFNEDHSSSGRIYSKDFSSGPFDDFMRHQAVPSLTQIKAHQSSSKLRTYH